MTAVPVTVSVRLDPSRLLATVEVALLTRLTREKQITLVSGASDGDGERRTIQPGEIVAVYPDGDETLWGIAKKFGVPPAKIARENRLPDAAAESPDAPASLDGCVRLLLG